MLCLIRRRDLGFECQEKVRENRVVAAGHSFATLDIRVRWPRMFRLVPVSQVNKGILLILED